MAESVQLAGQRFVRDSSTWLIYILLGYYSYLLNGLGPLTPFLRAEMGLAYTVASLHFSAFAAGMLLAGLTTDRVIRRIGRRRTMWGGAAGMAASALLLMVFRHPALTIAAALLMGTLGSALLVAIPAILTDRYHELRAIALMEANTTASACATAAPICIGLLARTPVGWRGALALPVVALLVIVVAYRNHPLPLARLLPAAQAARRGLPRRFWRYWTLLVLVVSVEFCIIFWAADFLENARGLARADAALSTSLFLAAMVTGRLLGSRILRRADSRWLMLAALGLAVLGFLLQWQLRPLPVVALGLTLAGLGVANLYPLSLSLAVGAAPDQLDAASARASLASGTAILLLPLLLGRLADLLGIAAAYGLVGVLLALSLVLVLAKG